jgi:hypothetical protein
VGGGGYSDIDEVTGLSAAFSVAGVSTMIASLRPVEDVVALLYQEIARAGHVAGTEQAARARISSEANTPDGRPSAGDRLRMGRREGARVDH